jgi:hypothetical protein
MKKIALLIATSTFLFSFDYFKTYNLNEFKDFKIYKPNGSFLESNINLPRGELSKCHINTLLYIYQKEKMVRDMLLILSKKYEYKFMPYISMLTQKHIAILDIFFDKYSIKKPKYEFIVGMYENQQIQDEYSFLLKKSIKDEITAANLSVKFMNELIEKYDQIISNEPPKDIKRELLKLNAFNKKVLRKFKKGLRNIEIGLPIE